MVTPPYFIIILHQSALYDVSEKLTRTPGTRTFYFSRVADWFLFSKISLTLFIDIEYNFGSE